METIGGVIVTSGGNTDNRDNRKRVRKELQGEGKCLYCHPHGGENGGQRHGHFSTDKTKKKTDPARYHGARWVPTKRKEVK
jgi:hypothetical protein